MANNPYVNKVVYGDTTVIDLTGDTVTADAMLPGYTAHDRSGASITGSNDLFGFYIDNDGYLCQRIGSDT